MIVSNIVKIVATRCHILMQKCTKFDFGWGSTLDPVGEAYSAPPDILAESNMQGLPFRGWNKTRKERTGWERKNETGETILKSQISD